MRFNSCKPIPGHKPRISGSLHLCVLFVMILWAMPVIKAQQGSNTQQGQDPYPYTKFSPQMAIIIVILIAALFFMGFFSVYIRHCSDTASGSNVRTAGGTVLGRSRRAARGLDASVLNTFPVLEYSEVKEHKIGKGALECAVCLCEFQDDETLRLLPKCDHVFHPECIDEWLASHTTCPVCRANLVPQSSDSVHGTLESETEADGELTETGRENPDEEAEDRRIILVTESEGSSSLTRNRTGGSRSNRPRKFSRSHTTGHSVLQPGENTERFTLRLPVEVRNHILNRELQRASSMVVFPRVEGSTRRGYRAGGEGSSRGKYSRRFDKLDRVFKSDRWVFAKTAPFFMRGPSMKSPKVATSSSDDKSKGQPIGQPRTDSARPPV